MKNRLILIIFLLILSFFFINSINFKEKHINFTTVSNSAFVKEIVSKFNFVGFNFPYINDVAKDDKGNFYLGLRTDDFMNFQYLGYSRALLVKLDPAGKFLMSKYYYVDNGWGTNKDWYSEIYSILPLKGKLYISGLHMKHEGVFSGEGYGFLIKTNENGEIEKQFTFKDFGFEKLVGLEDGNILLIGEGYYGSKSCVFIEKADKNLDKIWLKSYCPLNYEIDGIKGVRVINKEKKAVIFFESKENTSIIERKEILIINTENGACLKDFSFISTSGFCSRDRAENLLYQNGYVYIRFIGSDGNWYIAKLNIKEMKISEILKTNEYFYFSYNKKFILTTYYGDYLAAIENIKNGTEEFKKFQPITNKKFLGYTYVPDDLNFLIYINGGEKLTITFVKTNVKNNFFPFLREDSKKITLKEANIEYKNSPPDTFSDPPVETVEMANKVKSVVFETHNILYYEPPIFNLEVSKIKDEGYIFVRYGYYIKADVYLSENDTITKSFAILKSVDGEKWDKIKEISRENIMNENKGTIEIKELFKENEDILYIKIVGYDESKRITGESDIKSVRR